MKNCKCCKSEIDDRTKKCPYCGKKQKSLFSKLIKTLVIIFVIFIVIPMIFFGLTSNSDGDNSSNASSTIISKENYISNCKEIEYKELARNPDSHKGEYFKFTGEVIQVIEPSYGSTVQIRMDVTKTSFGYVDTIYAVVDIPKGSDRIIEDDIITIYGECDGLYTYKSILGSSVSVPKISIEYFDISTN